ncbi:MAG: hypothetical protein KDE28_20745 [Anaerolineales bacterium]|nr:hypothetical protein [Anaerolineales bacterium]
MPIILRKSCLALLGFSLILVVLTGCTGGPVPLAALPTLQVAAELPPALASSATADTAAATLTAAGIPPTFTPVPATASPTASPTVLNLRAPTETPRPIPTNTPVTPSPTPTETPTETPPPSSTPIAVLKPFNQYGPYELMHMDAYPRPAGDNGWGMHWIPTVAQEPGVVDRFVAEMVRMHIKWVVFLNDGTEIGQNDYLVDKLVANGIMPVMRLFRSGVLPYDGQVGPMVAHYRARGVYYFQLYNEPNVDDENHQFLSNPNQYAAVWADVAREVVNNGGLPGIGALSPGGSYNHYTFLERTLQAIKANGDEALLAHAWLSVHNYHGLRAFDDPDGFFLFRNYNTIVERELGRSLPMVGTEAGSYADDPNVEKQFISFQYNYMQNAEPYFFAVSYWLLANVEGGGHDNQWEWQTLFRPGYVHPVVTDFFYQRSQ